MPLSGSCFSDAVTPTPRPKTLRTLISDHGAALLSFGALARPGRHPLEIRQLDVCRQAPACCLWQEQEFRRRGKVVQVSHRFRRGDALAVAVGEEEEAADEKSFVL